MPGARGSISSTGRGRAGSLGSAVSFSPQTSKTAMHPAVAFEEVGDPLPGPAAAAQRSSRRGSGYAASATAASVQDSAAPTSVPGSVPAFA